MNIPKRTCQWTWRQEREAVSLSSVFRINILRHGRLFPLSLAFGAIGFPASAINKPSPLPDDLWPFLWSSRPFLSLSLTCFAGNSSLIVLDFILEAPWLEDFLSCPLFSAYEFWAWR
jgi:hypothetical protein